MNPIISTLLSALPQKRKATQSGWISINAPCCHHYGHRRDNRGRGGIKIEGESWVYNCFNCEFKTAWQPGKQLTENCRKLFSWLGVNEKDIGQLQLYCLKYSGSDSPQLPKLNFELVDKALPKNAKPVSELLEQGCTDPEFLECIAYLFDRGFELSWYNWHWTPEQGYKDRIIIPFYHDNRIVGWTARRITPGNKVKYLTSANPGYVFNVDSQPASRRYCIVVEGQLDAIAIDGVAIMHNDPSPVQCARINNLGKQVIVVPDRDSAGSVLINAALEHGWTVSLPPWGNSIKDVADAQKHYGRLYTLHTIVHYQETNKLKIKLIQKQLENLE